MFNSAAGVQHGELILLLSATAMPAGRFRGTLDLLGLDRTFKVLHEVLCEPVAGLVISRDAQSTLPAARAAVIDGDETQLGEYDRIERLYLIIENTTNAPLSFDDKLLSLHGVGLAPEPEDYERDAPAAVNDATIFSVTDAGGAAVAAEWQALPESGCDTITISGSEIIPAFAIGEAREAIIEHSEQSTFEWCEHPRVALPVGIRCTVLATGSDGTSTNGAQFVLFLENVAWASSSYDSYEPDILMEWTRRGVPDAAA